MAGILQTGTLVDGQWMTTNVDINTVLERHQEKKQEGLHTEIDVVPCLGLLTQTVINSSVIRWIFPARIRSSEFRDVAFIGVSSLSSSPVCKIFFLCSFNPSQTSAGKWNPSSKVESPVTFRRERRTGDFIPYRPHQDCFFMFEAGPNPPEFTLPTDNFVQIRRLDGNGHFHDVARKSDFAQRIRNACIIGSGSFEVSSIGDSIFSSQMRDGNGDISMLDVVGPELIPPQFILLVLESGDLIFLSARNVGMDVELITSHYKVLHVGWTEPSGKHLKVDPSSRYVAVASSEVTFAIYCLKSKEELCTQIAHGEPLNHIAAEHHLHRRGVIHKMEFLYPAADDPDHIILVLLVVRNGSTAMFVYEWEAGQNLTEIRSNNLMGYTLPSSCRMPMLLIPLTIMSAILFVSSESIVECHNLLEGSPKFQVIPQPEFAVSPIHLGIGLPLWTAWTRPLRHPRYSKGHDDIYMAREDGIIAFLEIVSDSTVLVQSIIAGGDFGRTIGTAFNNLELAPDGMDFLITGGDSCDGGSYLVAAKKWAQLVEPIPNWAPMTDFATTASTKSPRLVSQDSSESSKRRKLVLDDPDRVFACTGRGSHGAVSELRYGYEARIRLDIEGINYPVAETWAMPLKIPDPKNLVSELPSPLLFLLSVGDESILLHLTADLREIEEISQSSTWLDLQSRTLAALAYNGTVVQITEKTVSTSAEPLIMQNEGVQTEICRKEYPSSQSIVAAAIFENELALIVIKYASGDLQVSALRIHVHASSTNATVDEFVRTRPQVDILGSSFPLSQYPNSISIVRQSDGTTYGIICAAQSGFTRDVDLSIKSNVLSLSAIFRIQDKKGLLRVENPTDYWPLDQMSEFEISDRIPTRNDVSLVASIILLKFTSTIHLNLSIFLMNTANSFGIAERGVVPEACVSIVNLRGPQRDSSQSELLLAGYRSGTLVMIRYQMTCDGVLKATRTSQYSMGSTPVTFKTDPAMPNVALICCDSKLWRVTYDCSSNADPLLYRVWFTAVESPLQRQPSVNHVSILPQGLLLYSGNQLFVTSLDPGAKPTPRKMHLFGSPHRLLYSHRLEKLIVGMSQEGRSTIKFLDPESGSIVGRYIDVTGRAIAFPSGLGNSGEKILCLVEWEWRTANTTIDFIVVGTSNGSLLIYKTGLPYPTNSSPTQQEEIRCATFLEEHFDEPVSSIVTCAKSFFFSVGGTVRWVTLDSLGDKLWTHAEYKVSSRVVSMSIEGHWLNVLTVKHSLVTFLLVDKRQYPKCADQHGQLAPQFADQSERSGQDQILASDFYNNAKGESSLVMVGDLDCTVAGLWYSKKPQSLVSNHKIIFEADLPFSILKFRSGRTRPTWDRISQNSIAKSTSNSSELLGIGVDGSLIHFSILEEGVWKLLRFLQNLVRRSRGDQVMSHIPSQPGNKPNPRTKHVDGEVLRPYLSHRMLERLLMTDEARTEPGTDSRIIEEFCSLVNELHRGNSSPQEQPADGSLESCLEETYRLLADLLRPIL